ncbi:MAG: hypothetical protein M3277_06920 [Actinomycetota bacterium]|nr:hypothetical protein [Actinomycetota bacterium]
MPHQADACKSPEFDEAVAILYDAIVGKRSARESDAYVCVRLSLLRLVSARYHVTQEQVKDAVSDAFLKFIEAVRRGNVRRATAAAYWTRIALNEGANKARERFSLPFKEEIDLTGGEEDEAVCRLLDSRASAEIVADILDILVKEGETRCASTIATWLDLASSLSRPPSDREVAQAAGISHPTVAKDLRLFARYLELFQQSVEGV